MTIRLGVETGFIQFLSTYQLDLVTPGIKPAEAISRKVIRESLNLRIKARRRPVSWHLFTNRVGLASRGSWAREA